MTEKWNDILEYFKELEFNEKEHRYSVNGKYIRISASGVIKRFVREFPRQKMSMLVAKKRGISQTEVLAEWDAKRDMSCDFGHEVHAFGELYPTDPEMVPKNGHERAIVNFWNSVPDHVIPVIMELRMFHKELAYAGTADILLYNTVTEKFIIADYKTNEDLFKNYRDQKMLEPFEELLDSPFNKYQIQLSLYQMLFEQTGYEVSSRKIVWLRPDGDFQVYDTEDLTSVLKEQLSVSLC